MAEKELPPDGTEVIAMTYESIEYDRPALEVRGILRSSYVPVWDSVQCCVDGVRAEEGTELAALGFPGQAPGTVDGVQVDKETVRPVKECDPPRSIRTLIRALKHEDYRVAVSAAWTLGAIGASAKTAVPPLIQLLKDSAEPVDEEDARCWVAAVALGKFGPRAKAAVPSLIQMLANKDREIRARSGLALANIAPEAAKAAVPVLMELLVDPLDYLRDVAIEALGNIGPAAKDAIPALKSVASESYDEESFPLSDLAEDALQKIQAPIRGKRSDGASPRRRPEHGHEEKE